MSFKWSPDALNALGTLLLNAILYAGCVFLVLNLFTLIPDPHGELGMYLKILVATGTFGGVLRALFAREGSLELATLDMSKNPRLKVGTLGDILIGIGGSVAVFFVFANSIRLDASVGSMLMVISLGIIAGFAGRNVLILLQDKMQRQLLAVEKKAEDAGKAALELSTAKSCYAIAQSLLLAYDTTSVPADRRRPVLDQAIDQLHEALKADPKYTKAMTLLGYAKKRLALLDTTEPHVRRKLIKESVEHCQEALEKDPDLAVAYFNLACYQTLLWEDPPKAIIESLERAVGLKPSYLSDLKDPDLAELWKTDDFKSFCRRHGVEPPLDTSGNPAR